MCTRMVRTAGGQSGGPRNWLGVVLPGTAVTSWSPRGLQGVGVASVMAEMSERHSQEEQGANAG